jgi:hypothetical protein
MYIYIYITQQRCRMELTGCLQLLSTLFIFAENFLLKMAVAYMKCTAVKISVYYYKAELSL